MRTLSGTLIAAQQSASKTPAINVSIGFGLTSLAPIMSIEHIESVQGGSAVIVVNTANQQYPPGAFKGLRLIISWGYGDELIESAPLWVVTEKHNSEPGKNTVELQCLDQISLLAQGILVKSLTEAEEGTLGPPMWNIPNAPADASTAATILEIITEIMTGLQSVILDKSDGRIDVDKPPYAVQMNQKRLEIILDLLDRTQCGMYMRSDGLHIKYLDPDGTTDYIYSLATHPFFIAAGGDGYALPNYFIAVDRYPQGFDQSTYFGSARDAESSAWFGTVAIAAEDESIESDDQAADIAALALSRAQSAVGGGAVVAPMNCGQELYDIVEVLDTRTNNTIRGRVGRIIRHWQPGEYNIEVDLVGITRISSISQLRWLWLAEWPYRMIDRLFNRNQQFRPVLNLVRTLFNPQAMINQQIARSWPAAPPATSPGGLVQQIIGWFNPPPLDSPGFQPEPFPQPTNSRQVGSQTPRYKRKIRWFVAGNLSVGDEQGGIFTAEGWLHWVSVLASAKVKTPSADFEDVVVQIRVEPPAGGSYDLFSRPLTIEVGATDDDNLHVFDVNQRTILAGSRLFMDIDQVGVEITGADLTVELEVEQLTD